MPTKALIVDDHPIIVESLTTSLVSLRIFDQVDSERSLANAEHRLAREADYDLVLLDLHMDDSTGTEAMTQLREAYPDLPLVIFSADESADTISTAFDLGVQGYIPKSSSMPVVLGAIRMVMDGGSYIPPNVAKMLGLGLATPIPQEEEGFPDLSPRQDQIFRYVLQGLPNKIIAARLDIAHGTVKTHISTIYRILGVRNRAQAILKARHLGRL